MSCAPEETPGLTREQFVRAYVGLVRARIDAAEDSAAYLAGRDRALQRAGVTAEEMRAFARAGRRRPDVVRAAWQDIAAKLDTLYGGVTSELSPSMREALEDAAEETDFAGEGGGELDPEGELTEGVAGRASEPVADTAPAAAVP